MAQLPALHQACLDGSLEGVRAALAQPDAQQVLQTPDADGRTPLHWAVSSDAKYALIEALQAAGPLDVNARDASLWTPLMIASSAGALRVVQWLLAHGAVMHQDLRTPESGWATLRDPEGNEFCILRSEAERPDPYAHLVR